MLKLGCFIKGLAVYLRMRHTGFRFLPGGRGAGTKADVEGRVTNLAIAKSRAHNSPIGHNREQAGNRSRAGDAGSPAIPIEGERRCLLLESETGRAKKHTHRAKRGIQKDDAFGDQALRRKGYDGALEISDNHGPKEDQVE